MENFIDLVQKRRSNYSLGNQIDISKEDLIKSIQEVVKDVPSFYNTQSTKVILLTDESHIKFWDIVTETLRKIVKANAFSRTQAKMDSFKAAYGTILYFNDPKPTEDLIKNMPTYAETFPSWAIQSNAMVQYALWLELMDLNLGASLQHYNPLIDDEVKKVFDIPKHWELIAEMPFGNITKPADSKEYMDINERVFVK